MSFSDYLENFVTDAIFRGGAVNSSGAAGSSACVKGFWIASTAYSVGDRVVPHASMTGAGGKFLVCTTAGTSGSTNTLAVPNPGVTLSDGSVTWTAVSGVPCPPAIYAALLTINKGLRVNSTVYSVGDCVSITPTGGAGGDAAQHVYRCTTGGTSGSSQPATYLGVPGEVITDGTAGFTELSPVLDTNTGFPSGLAEVSGGSYARVKVNAGTVPALSDFAGTQSTGSTTSSTGASGQTSNNNAITFPTPTANWATGGVTVGVVAFLDQSSGGNMLDWAALTVPKSVNNGDSAPAFAAGQFTSTIS